MKNNYRLLYHFLILLLVTSTFTNNVECTKENDFEKLPDLTIYNLLVVPYPDGAIIDNPFMMFCGTVYNIGDKNATNVSIHGYVYLLNATTNSYSDWIPIGNTTISYISPNNRTSFEIDWRYFDLTISKGYDVIEFRVVLDQYNNIIEKNETNNEATTRDPPYTHPDLKVSNSDITFSNEQPKIGEEVKISVVVKNLGYVEAKNVLVEIYKNNILLDQRIIKSLKVNETNLITTNWIAKEGEHTFKIVVSINYSLEVYGTNNEALRTIFVKPDEVQKDNFIWIILVIISIIIIILLILIKYSFNRKRN